ncbi:hypothetical protein [Cellulosimicrobium sp. TH-20]|uniref:hypothetical protein n=1 Tax=unclassified Cellulosimicrobium TaxID=2624466 RepID=UPI001581D60F
MQKNSWRAALAAAVVGATVLVGVGQASAVTYQYMDKELNCRLGDQVRIQGRTTGETDHKLVLGSGYYLWYKGYKNNITSTTYTHVQDGTARILATRLVSSNVSSCVTG